MSGTSGSMADVAGSADQGDLCPSAPLLRLSEHMLGGEDVQRRPVAAATGGRYGA